MSHPIPTLEYEDNNGQDPDIDAIAEDLQPFWDEPPKVGKSFVSPLYRGVREMMHEIWAMTLNK